jgi:hypothetical protein
MTEEVAERVAVLQLVTDALSAELGAARKRVHAAAARAVAAAGSPHPPATPPHASTPAWLQPSAHVLYQSPLIQAARRVRTRRGLLNLALDKACELRKKLSNDVL